MQNFESEINQGYRLSPQQAYIWSLSQSQPVSAFQVSASVSITGNLNIDIFQKVIYAIVERHEILRTSFTLLPGMITPLQKIENKVTLNYKYHSLSELAPLECQKKLSLIKKDFQNKPFDFNNNSLLYSQLIQLYSESFILLLRLPAICGDSLTLNQLVEEISQLYQSYLKPQVINEPELQYADIAEWFYELLEDEETEIGRKYWQDQDLTAINHFSLFIEKNMQQSYKFSYQKEVISLTDEFQDKIKTVVKHLDLSIQDFFLASFAILLFKLTRKSDILMGILSRGRSYEELDQAIGLFSKYLPQNVQINNETHFIEFVEQVRQNRLDNEKWQDYFTWENIEVDDTNNQYLSYCYDWYDNPSTISLENLSFSITDKFTHLAPFQLKLTSQITENKINLEFHYNNHTFEQQDIQQLKQQFIVLLHSIIQNPNSSIYKLEVLSPSDKQRILIDFNQTAQDYSQIPLIYQQFEQQVEPNSQQPAVIFEQDILTYEQLNKKSNKLAHYLISQGVKPHSIVGLYLERSINFIVGMLAIHKAGAAYLPLDPAFPKESLMFRLQDADVSFIISQHQLIENIENCSANVIDLETDWGSIEIEKKDNPNISIAPDSLAYIIYTSGSTGKPKGVGVEHQQIINYVSSIKEQLELPSNGHFAHVSSFAADLGNTAIFPTLSSGGCLHIISQEKVGDADKLAEYFRNYKIDCLKIVPSHFSTLLAAASSPQDILPKQRLIFGGEALNWSLIEQLNQYSPQCKIYNHYGPTETTIGVLTYPVDLKKFSQKAQTVPLGRPLSNTQVYLLDEFLRPVPVGVPGELYIGGANVSRGYLNRSELNEQRFINNPFLSHSKLYKTGDLGRYLPTGVIEYLGRIDYQVKIRGFRLELGEIEVTLMKHPDIREAVVTVREDTPVQKQLIAYVTIHKHLQSNKKKINQDIKNYLKTKLPDYMIPNVFIVLESLPLTPNGKIDRHRLPNPDKIIFDIENYQSPRNPIEEILVKIWSDILQQEKVSINHNFFELGGDSIISIQVIARANQAGIKFTPKQLFENPTIAELAAIAQVKSVSTFEQGLIEGKAILTPIQNWFFEQNFPNPHHWNQTILLEVEADVNVNYLQQSFKQLLIHHDSLRLRFNYINNNWIQSYSLPDEIIPLEVVDLSRISPSEQKKIIEEKASNCQTSLNLAEGSTIKSLFFHLGQGKTHRLLIVIHHLVVDGVSWRILLEDLVTVYQQFEQQRLIELPAKTTSFKQWSTQLHNYAQSNNLTKELDYWLQISKTQPNPLPVDYWVDFEQNTVSSMKQVTWYLNEEETRSLLQDIPATYNTQINDILLTALIQSFYHWTEQSSLLLDLEGHGREDLFEGVDLSRTVGWFTSIFPVLLTLPKTQNLGEHIKSIKEQLRQIPNKGIGYGILRYLTEDPEISKQMKKLPQPQIRFNYMGKFEQEISTSPFIKLALESTGLSEDPHGINRYLIYINGMTVSEKLEITWTYSSKFHHESTIQSLAEEYMKALKNLIVYCQSVDESTYTPSDFPTANLTQEELDELLEDID